MQAIVGHLNLIIRLEPQQEAQIASKAPKAIILAKLRECNKKNVGYEYKLTLEIELQCVRELDSRHDKETRAFSTKYTNIFQ